MQVAGDLAATGLANTSRELDAMRACKDQVFFFTLVTGLSRSLSLKLSDTRVYEPPIRARLGTTDKDQVPFHQPLARDQIIFLNCLDVYFLPHTLSLFHRRCGSCSGSRPR